MGLGRDEVLVHAEQRDLQGQGQGRRQGMLLIRRV